MGPTSDGQRLGGLERSAADFGRGGDQRTVRRGAVFGNGAGYSGRIDFTVASLAVDYGVSLTGSLQVTLFVDAISTMGASSAFAVDNFTAHSAGSKTRETG